MAQEPIQRVQDRYEAFCRSAEFVLRPEFPRELLIEVANICNHACVFCAYRLMTRPKGVMDLDFYRRVLREAYRLGARDIGLYAGAEPFAVKRLELYVEAAKEIGFDYVYITTNGSMATPGRVKKVIAAGLDSIKFSINGGDRETYKAIHGKDDFEKALRILRTAHEYRKTLTRPLRLYVSFVENEINRASFARLQELVGPMVDDIFHVQAANVSGQNPDLPTIFFEGYCPQPFQRVTISQEGFLRMCCNDYQNMLAVEDLNKMPLGEAWLGERMVEMRRRHLEDNLKGTLCYNCLTGKNVRALPLNPALSSHGMISTLPVQNDSGA